MQIGKYRVYTVNHGFYRLDGGAMFGTVPKTLWESRTVPDLANRISLATRSLVIEFDDRKLMIDTGCGDKWTAKLRSIYCLADEPYRPIEGITDLVLTHLHFDHAGGLTSNLPYSTGVSANYPEAVHYVPGKNLENARQPNTRERASYLAENYGVIDIVDHHLISASDEIFPGLRLHESNGHTQGLLWISLTIEGQTFAFPSDMVPTSLHLPIPYVMGYDICADQSMQEKSAFLSQAEQDNWIVVFQHDPIVHAGRVGRNARNAFHLQTAIDL